MEDNFYQNKYFEQLTTQINGLQTGMQSLETKVDKINNKFAYIYGFAGACSLIGSLAVDWVRVHIFNLQ